MVSQEKFIDLTKYVIDFVEGGYYHPAMLSGFKPADQAILRASGETLYGLDRENGKQLAMYPEWKVFWDFVDRGRMEKPGAWRYNRKDVPYADKLKQLAAAIMYQWFLRLAKKYILFGSMDEIAADDRLIIHFSYASWNGEAWFERYSNALNKAVEMFPGNREAIFGEAFKARTQANKYIRVAGKWVNTGLPNRVIRQQGQNLMILFKKINLA